MFIFSLQDTSRYPKHICTKVLLTKTLTSTVVGILISIPIGVGAARNLAPLPIYALCRTIIALSRSFQEIIIAILFVAMVGFGPLAGFLTLAFWFQFSGPACLPELSL
jgi:ABC-type phosphate/phosphonate transport system permease subunit